MRWQINCQLISLQNRKILGNIHIIAKITANLLFSKDVSFFYVQIQMFLTNSYFHNRKQRLYLRDVSVKHKINISMSEFRLRLCQTSGGGLGTTLGTATYKIYCTDVDVRDMDPLDQQPTDPHPSAPIDKYCHPRKDQELRT